MIDFSINRLQYLLIVNEQTDRLPAAGDTVITDLGCCQPAWLPSKSWVTAVIDIITRERCLWKWYF